MDISETLAPTSDQLDAVDLMTGPRTFTITGVSAGNAEQPVEVSLAEFPRVWRPSKGMRRVLAMAWGADASKWVGRKVTLYCDPNVTFGKDKVGGTRISHLSDLPGGKALSVPLLVTRGKSKVYTVEPLAAEPATPSEPTAEQVAASTDVAELRRMWHAASPALRQQIEARVAGLTAAAPETTQDELPEDNFTDPTP